MTRRTTTVFDTTKLIFVVLAAAVVSLACVIAGMFVARARLLEASEWVRHTSDVELAVANCRVHVREAQLSALTQPARLEQAGADIALIERLTVDNPLQQRRIGALLPSFRAFSGDAAQATQIDDALQQLGLVERSLKDARMVTLVQATRAGWLASSASTALTVCLVAMLFGALRRHSKKLERVHSELRREGAMLESVVESMVDGVIAITPSRAFLHVNRAARRLLGDEFPTGIFPKDWRSNLECSYEDGSEMNPEDGALARAIKGLSTDNLVYKSRQRHDPDDAGTWLSASGRPVYGSDGSVIAAVVALRDLTEHRRQQDQLRAMSMSDELTRLHNRRGFSVLAEQHARVSRRHKVPFAIVFADLNGLKLVNDSLGHEAGDQMICSAAEVLRMTFRESDIVARYGGDEFVALLANADPSMQEAILERLRACIEERNAVDIPRLPLSLSVGISFFDPDHPLSLPELMVEADRLMYVDKREQGRVASEL
ncbi:MAG TPA: diguanylate cyclase [Polyangiaceae bacterium]